MATTIRVKRKKSTGNDSVVLKAGEPYYNLFDRQLYVGDGSTDFPKCSLTHIKEYGVIDDVVAFGIGPVGQDDQIHNFYEKKINNVDTAKSAKSVVLDSAYYGTEPPWEQTSLQDAPTGTVYIQLQSED